MKPVSPVIPNAEIKEVIVAKKQDEYQNLPAIFLEGGVILTRWKMTEEERRIVAETGDIYLLQWNGDGPVTPILLQVEAPEINVQPASPIEPKMITAVRYSEKAVANAARFGLETFTDQCADCGYKILFTQPTLDTLKSSPGMKIICMDCFTQMQTENPELEGVYLPNTRGEMAQIAEVLEKDLINENENPDM